jgi:hypothetical protein
VKSARSGSCGRDRLLQLLAGEDRPPLCLRHPRPLRLKHQHRRDRAAPPKAPRSELVDPADDGKRNRDGRLALALCAQLPNKHRQIVSRHANERPRLEPRPQMFVDDAAVLGLRRVPQIEHRSSEPRVRCLAGPQLRLRSDALTAAARSSRTLRRRECAVNGSPAQATDSVLVADLKHACGADRSRARRVHDWKPMPDQPWRRPRSGSIGPGAEQRHSSRSELRKNSLHPTPACSVGMDPPAASRRTLSRPMPRYSAARRVSSHSSARSRRLLPDERRPDRRRTRRAAHAADRARYSRLRRPPRRMPLQDC